MKKNKLAAAVCLSLSFAASSLCASDDIETITVSSTPISVDEAGASISIIDRDDILLKNAPTLQELLREVPGFAVSQQGSNGAVTQVRVRGAEANQVLVMIDGIEANDLAQGGEFDFSNILTGDIERIEIVRGPQSSLWGSDAMAGVINIITRPGATEAGSSFEANAEGGSFSTVRGGATYRHASEASQLQFTIDYLDTDGTNISRRGSEDDGYENTTVSLSGNWDMADNFATSYTVRYTDTTTDFDAIDFVTDGLPTDADNFTESEYLYAGVRFQHTINEKFSQSLALSLTDTDNETDSGGAVNSISRGEKERARYQLDYHTGVHRFALLAEYEGEEYSQRGLASPFGDPNHDREQDTTSFAFEYRFDGEQIDASLSAREDDNSEFDDATAWRATVNWQAASGTTILHASLGESFKNPTMTERYGFFTNFTGNPDLKPEESFAWEVGIKQSFMDDRLQTNLTYFDADLTDEIDGFVFDPVTFGFTAANVDGESERSGVELEISYLASANFEIGGHYTYVDASQEDAAGKDVTEVRRPEDSASLYATYRFNKGAVHFAISHTGEQEDDYFPPFPPFQERVELDAFTLVSLSGRYQLTDALMLTARLENVTDEEYEQVYGFESPGFGGYVGLRMQW